MDKLTKNQLNWLINRLDKINIKGIPQTDNDYKLWFDELHKIEKDSRGNKSIIGLMINYAELVDTLASKFETEGLRIKISIEETSFQ